MPWMKFRAPVRCGAFLSSFCQDDEAAVSRQRLKVLRDDFAECGEAWLRDELASHNVKQLHGVAAAAAAAARDRCHRLHLHRPRLWVPTLALQTLQLRTFQCHSEVPSTTAFASGDSTACRHTR